MFTNILQRLETTVALHEAQAVPIEALCADQQFVLARIGQEVRLERRCTRSLDLRKAYDTVWRDGLFYKLLKKGVDGKLWRVLRDMFAKTSSRVRVNDQLSDAFPWPRSWTRGTFDAALTST
jgi:hypothetical protein